MRSVSVSSCRWCMFVSQCCVLHDMQFVNAGRGCNRQPYIRGILQSRSHNCFIGSHECLLLFTPSVSAFMIVEVGVLVLRCCGCVCCM